MSQILRPNSSRFSSASFLPMSTHLPACTIKLLSCRHRLRIRHVEQGGQHQTCISRSTPVPGGPNSSKPRAGERAPINSPGFFIGHTTSSWIICFAWSWPALILACFESRVCLVFPRHLVQEGLHQPRQTMGGIPAISSQFTFAEVSKISSHTYMPEQPVQHGCAHEDRSHAGCTLPQQI